MNHRIRAHHSRGFSLIELMVVVIVMSAIAGISIMWWQATQRQAIRESLIAQQSEQMAMINRAAYEFVRGNDWAATGTDTTQPFSITMTELATAGTLPWQIPEQTPLGQDIRIRARTVDDKWYVVVYAAGEPQQGRTAAAGIPPTQDALRSFSASVMRRLRDTHLTSAGVISWGESADLLLSGFTSDFNRLIEAPATWPTTVAMAGFSQFAVVPPVEFEGEGGGGKCAAPRSYVMTTPGTYNWTLDVAPHIGSPNFTAILVGGGGGGHAGQQGTGTAGGGGGGSGAKRVFTSDQLSTPYAAVVVVGAGGGPGAHGQDTRIRSHIAPGGRAAAGSMGGAAGGEGGFPGQSGGGYTGSFANGRGPHGAGGGEGGGGGGRPNGEPGSGGGGAGGPSTGSGGSGRIEFHWNEWIDC